MITITEIITIQFVLFVLNGTMLADIFKRKMAHAIQLKWTF